MRFAFIARHRNIWPVAWLCDALDVSRSGFHAWLNRSPSARSRHDEVLVAQIDRSFKSSDRTYGARRVWHDLLAEGLSCGLHRIERLMRENGLRARPRRRGLPKDTGERAAVSDNLLDRAFQVHLVSTGISWPALNQTVCALRFFCGVTLGHAEIPERIAYARAPRTLPVVLSADEVVRFLEAVPSLKTRTALTTAYAAGLRASETVGLKVSDIDSERGVIRVEHGKGGKDRTVMLSAQLLRILRVYWRLAKPKGWLFPGRMQIAPSTFRYCTRPAARRVQPPASTSA
ncbi:integrase/recombinase [Mesorhizobium japonicum MAFF 303099]|uniref:Integrase/recombinase n=1 Tax=Mesorhizobium japonicum (strain LMG 29417 / CECT 9101 / MAFF 303099) TaxID=266835 RepID=Q98AJ6_RHILO|nr:integrase/recombinase [Mesorhizobium japonicum MAFF 303099]